MKKRPINILKVLNKGINFIEDLQDLASNLHNIIQVLNEAQKQQQQIKPVKVKERINSYEVLGVFPDDPIELIKDIYKTKVKSYHPDKGGKDEKFIAIDKAYKAILKERKEKENA